MPLLLPPPPAPLLLPLLHGRPCSSLLASLQGALCADCLPHPPPACCPAPRRYLGDCERLLSRLVKKLK